MMTVETTRSAGRKRGGFLAYASASIISFYLLGAINYMLSDSSLSAGAGVTCIGATSLSEDTRKWLHARCNTEQMNFETIEDFREFLGKFKNLSEEQLKSAKVRRKCRQSRQAILDLESLVKTDNVCDPKSIDEIIAYHEKHLRQTRALHYLSMAGNVKAPVTMEFFTKYAIRVAYTCKKNLVKNLELARDELRARSKVFEEARDRVYNEEPSIKANVKLIEEQPDDPVSSNLQPRDETELTMSEYREALTQLRRPEDVLTFDRKECVRSRSRHVHVSQDKISTFFKPALMCHQLARFYSGSLLSIARLANIGYMAIDAELDLKLADDPMVRDWVIAVQVCEPMMYMRALVDGTASTSSDKRNNIHESNDNNKANNDSKDILVAVDTCAERVSTIEEMAYEDTLEELDQEQLNEMLLKSEATREQAQKLMKSAMKKMAKANLLKQLSKGNGRAKRRGIFSKSFELLGAAVFGGSSSVASKFAVPTAARENVAGQKTATSWSVAEQLARNILESSLIIGHPATTTPVQDEAATPDEATFESLIEMCDSSSGARAPGTSTGVERNELDREVAAFDPLTSLASTITVIAIMLTFEWLFFIVMTLAARICHRLYFNFDNLLTFPPKMLSWSDADFARYNDKLEQIDEDDLNDYDELTPDEQRQRDLLAKVFGKPPPMIFKE